MDSVRVGIIGAGKMGILHSCLFNKIKGSQLVAICDNTPLHLKLLRSVLPKVSLYEDYLDMIERSKLDLTVVTTPVFLHKRMAQKAIESGSAVFVEKPLALNASECRELVQIGGKAITLVGYCRRFMGTYNMAKDIIDSSSLGKVTSFDSHMFVTQVSDDRSGWQFDAKRSGGGVVMDLGSHGVDMLHYLLGNVEEVRASGNSRSPEQIEDEARLDLMMSNDVRGTLEVSWSKSGFRLPELLLDIKCENGRLRVCEKYIEIVESKGGKVDTTVHYKQAIEKGVQFNVAGPEYTREDEHIVQSIMSGKDTRCNFAAAAETNYVIEAAYRSMWNDSIEQKVR